MDSHQRASYTPVQVDINDDGEVEFSPLEHHSEHVESMLDAVFSPYGVGSGEDSHDEERELVVIDEPQVRFGHLPGSTSPREKQEQRGSGMDTRGLGAHTHTKTSVQARAKAKGERCSRKEDGKEPRTKAQLLVRRIRHCLFPREKDARKAAQRRVPGLWHLWINPVPKKIFPERLLHANGEMIVILVITSVVITSIYDNAPFFADTVSGASETTAVLSQPAVGKSADSKDNMLKTVFGFNPICFFLDIRPAAYFVLPLLVCYAYLAIRYGNANSLRLRLERSRINNAQYYFGLFTNGNLAFVSMWLPLFMVVIPEITVRWHMFLFMYWMNSQFLAVVANLAITRYSISWATWCWILIYGLSVWMFCIFTTINMFRYDYVNFRFPPGVHPLAPTVHQFFDVLSFLALPVSFVFLPCDPASIRMEYLVEQDHAKEEVPVAESAFKTLEETTMKKVSQLSHAVAGAQEHLKDNVVELLSLKIQSGSAQSHSRKESVQKEATFRIASPVSPSHGEFLNVHA